jgi:hypothetical protein
MSMGWSKNGSHSFLMDYEDPNYKTVVENIFDKFQN